MLVATIAASLASSAAPWSIIPQPLDVRPGRGTFELNASTPVFYDLPEARSVALYLAEELRGPLAGRMPVFRGAPRAADPPSVALALRGSDISLGEEGYELVATPRRVLIRAARPPGLFYGVQTLRQMLPAEVFGARPFRVPLELRCGTIVDRPRFRWRGYLLDVGRHYRSVGYIKQTIDRLASLKMNVLHWHLTEDQGWRLEIRRYPKLTEIGAWRVQNGVRYGGFYTQREVREIVRYAAARHVRVVPEIEMPGHCVAALAAYPQYSCSGGPFEVANRWGVFSDVYCAGNDDALRFLKDVLDETMELFPSQYIHVGGDEVPKDRWRACPRCQARIRTEGLRNEDELQSWFLRQIGSHIASRGRKMVAWDEILEGGLVPNATVQSWRGMEGAVAAARLGHDAVVSPTSHCYLDYPLSAISLERAYSFEPVPPELDSKEAIHILGLEGNMWGERTPEDADVDRQTYPRLVALAEVAWSDPSVKDWEDFQRRLSLHRERMRLQGILDGSPAGRRIGGWSPREVSESPHELAWDLGRVEPGRRLEVEFVYEAGAHGLELLRVWVEAGGRTVAVDAHRGFAGTFPQLPRYRLLLPAKLPDDRLVLRALVRSDGGRDSQGSVYLVSERNRNQR